MTTSNGGRKVIPSFYSHIVSGWAITCVVADREGQVQRNEKGAISAINMQKATLPSLYSILGHFIFNFSEQIGRNLSIHEPQLCSKGKTLVNVLY